MIDSIQRALDGLQPFADRFYRGETGEDVLAAREAYRQLTWAGECLAKHRCISGGPGACKGHGEEKSSGTCIVCGGRYGGGLFRSPSDAAYEQRIADLVAELARVKDEHRAELKQMEREARAEVEARQARGGTS